MRSYMLLFWAPKHILAEPRSAEQAEASGALWHAWAQALESAGHSVTGAQLDDDARCVTGASGAVANGSFGDHVLGGYFVVSASSLEQATDLAKGCPILRNGGTVEVRPVMPAG